MGDRLDGLGNLLGKALGTASNGMNKLANWCGENLVYAKCPHCGKDVRVPKYGFNPNDTKNKGRRTCKNCNKEFYISR